MKDISLRLQNELRRLASGPLPNEKPDGLGSVTFTISCANGAKDVLTRAKIVLSRVDDAVFAGWPANGRSKPAMPDWFVSACAQPMSSEQATQWLSWWKRLPSDEQARAEREKNWSLDDWLYWMEPDNRQWFWWDAKTSQERSLIALAVEVDAWPFPWGALRWLFRAAGASDVKAEE